MTNFNYKSQGRPKFLGVGSVLSRLPRFEGEIMAVGGETWRARSASLLWGSGGRAHSGVQGQSPRSGGQGGGGGGGGRSPLKLKAFYCLHVQVHRKFASFSAFGLGQGLEKCC